MISLVIPTVIVIILIARREGIYQWDAAEIPGVPPWPLGCPVSIL